MKPMDILNADIPALREDLTLVRKDRAESEMDETLLAIHGGIRTSSWDDYNG